MDLDVSIEFAIEEFRKDVFREFYGSNSEHPAIDVVANATRLILALSHGGTTALSEEAAESGSLPAGISLEGSSAEWQRLPAMLDEVALREPVLSELQTELAARHCTRTRDLAARMLDVVAVVTEARASIATTRYLVRAINCYVLGLSAECHIMCRSVLEQAVNGRFRRAEIDWPRDKRGRETMNARIGDAVARGWLLERQGRRARDIWLRGNKAVHDDPESVGNARETLAWTLDVVGACYCDNT